MITRGALAQVARGADPVWFAMVMATGIVSAAVRQAGLPALSAALLTVAAASLVILVAASCWRAAVYPADLRADLTCPDRAFACFAFVAACAVLGNGLAAAGQPTAAAALAAAALAAWLTLTCLIPARLATRPSARPPITAVNGTWYLWPVATQSLAIAAAFVRTGGLLPAGLAAATGTAAWSAGITLYIAVMVLVAARLLQAGPGPADAAALAPYWVAMGAASISAFAAARILHPAAARPVITGVAVTLWAVATGLIPVLATLTVRCLRPPARPRYRPQAWAIVFPLGMYATASLQLGTAARLPLIHHIGTAAVWPAAAAWAVTFIAMATSPLTRRSHSAHPKHRISRQPASPHPAHYHPGQSGRLPR